MKKLNKVQSQKLSNAIRRIREVNAYVLGQRLIYSASHVDDAEHVTESQDIKMLVNQMCNNIEAMLTKESPLSHAITPDEQEAKDMIDGLLETESKLSNEKPTV